MAVILGITFGNDVAEAEHVYAGILNNLVKCRRVGINDAEVKAFAGLIERGRHERDKQPKRADQKIKRARAEVVEGVMAYRTAADLVAAGIGGREAPRERELLVQGPFPANDTKKLAYLAELDEVMKRNSAALAARGFGKEAQAKLGQVGARFAELLHARGKDRSEGRKARAARNALIVALRTETNYFRRAGRAAVGNGPGAADFKRLGKAASAPKKVAAAQASESPKAGLVAKAD